MKKEERREKIIKILRSHGIKMEVTGCGCWCCPRVTFIYKGEVVANEEDYMTFKTPGL